MSTMVQPATVVHVAPGAGEVVRALGDVLTIKLGSALTGGAVVLSELVVQPGGGPPMLHTHPPLEAFYVLEGEFEVNGLGADGPFTARATPGSAIYVPPRAPHNFKNVGTNTGRLIVIYTSPALEAFGKDLAAAADAAPAGRPDPAALMPVLAKHEVAFVDAAAIPA